MAKHVRSGVQTDAGQAATLGKLLTESGKFPEVNNPAEAAAKVLAGKELGVGPVQSMSIQLVNGKIVMDPPMMASLIQRSDRHGYRITQHDETQCEIEFFRDGEPIGTSLFTAEDAGRAGLTEGSSWQSSARNALFEGAIRNGARWYCPEVFCGVVYTSFEIGLPQPSMTPIDDLTVDSEVAPDIEVQNATCELASLIQITGSQEGPILNYYKVSSLEEMTLEQRQEAVQILEHRLKKNKTNEEVTR